MIVLMEGTPEKKAFLCHQEILENCSGYFFQKINRFYDDKECSNGNEVDIFPLIDLSDYPNEQVVAALNCFYTHELQIYHNDITRDFQMLVKELDSKLLSKRYQITDKKWIAYNLYQHGDRQAYSNKAKRGGNYGQVQHRGTKRVGELDCERLTKPSKMSKKFRGYNYDDDNSSSVMSICTKFSNTSVASSHHNSIVNGASNVRDCSNQKRKSFSSRKF